MICPDCRKARLEAVYRWLPPQVYHLDSGRPSLPRRELTHIICPCCEAMWYALAGETAQDAFNRIQQEEPRP